MLVLAAVLGAAHVAAAGENDDYRFARRLHDDGMFAAAAEEYLRFADAWPASVFRPAALIGAGECWMRAGEAERALDAFDRLLREHPADEAACKARFYRGRIFEALERFRLAAEEYARVPEDYGGCPFADDALLASGESLIAAGEFAAAAAALRRFGDEHRESDLAPRAFYSLAVALDKTGRDLEAAAVLERLVDDHPGSPVAALALQRLGERAYAAGNRALAEERFRRILDRYEEPALRETAARRIVEIRAGRGDDEGALKAATEYLRRFPEAAERAAVYREAIDAARRLGRRERALALLDEAVAGGIAPDTSGAYAWMRGELLAGLGRRDEALAALGEFRRAHPLSGRRAAALLLEASLRRSGGEVAEASRLLHLALLEGVTGDERLDALASLAVMAEAELADTLAALRYLDMIADEDEGGERAARALLEAGNLREAAGDATGAGRRYERLMDGYPGTEEAGLAAAALERLDLLPRPTAADLRRLARVVAGDGGRPERLVDAAVVLLERAGDAREAGRLLDEALRDELPDSLRARARFHRGEALLREARLAESAGRDGGKSRREALSQWVAVARDAAGTAWGRRAHRAYLAEKEADWDAGERLRRLDEFLGFYGGSPDRWWAIGRRIDALAGLAGGGERWAADSALTLSGEVLAGGAPDRIAREALLRRGSLLRMIGDAAGAAEALTRFADRYGDDPRATGALSDAGEALFGLGRYDDARKRFARCGERAGRRRVAARCALRVGDCHYSLRRWADAARAYSVVIERYGDGRLVDEARYRKALALDQLGRTDEADLILGRLVSRDDLPQTLRARVLERRARRLIAGGETAAAVGLVDELVSIERTAATLALRAELFLEDGRNEDAAREFGQALERGGADTCAVLAGRAAARYRGGDAGRGDRDLALIEARCPRGLHAAAVLLEKGRAAVAAEACEEAEATLGALRERFAGTETAAEALYELARCDLKRGGWDRGIERLRRFLVEAPASPMIDRVYFSLASAYFASGDQNLAAEHYDLAAEATADRDRRLLALQNLGRVRQRLEDWEKAADAWRALAEEFPGRPESIEALFNLGFCHTQAGKFELAWEVYRRIPGVARTEEQRGRAHYWSGAVLKNLGRYDEAIREFLRVPYLNTGGMWGVTAKLEAAGAYEMTGRFDEAERIYRAVLDNHGPNTDWGRIAADGLERIESRRGGEGKADSDGA